MVEVRDVAYEADGLMMVGRLAVPDRPGPRPAVLIAHEANGLDDHQKRRAERVAELGFVAFALDSTAAARRLPSPTPRPARPRCGTTPTACATSPGAASRSFSPSR